MNFHLTERSCRRVCCLTQLHCYHLGPEQLSDSDPNLFHIFTVEPCVAHVVVGPQTCTGPTKNMAELCFEIKDQQKKEEKEEDLPLKGMHGPPCICTHFGVINPQHFYLM